MVERCEKRTLKFSDREKTANQCLLQCKRRWCGEQRLGAVLRDVVGHEGLSGLGMASGLGSDHTFPLKSDGLQF